MSSGEITPEAKAAGEEKDDGQNPEENGEEKHKMDDSKEESVEAEKIKHQRGGRKAKSSSATNSESHKPWSERNGRLEKFSESEPLPEEPVEPAETERRAHQRGGRKAKAKSRLTSESNKPWSERNGRLEKFSESDSQPEEALAEEDALLNHESTADTALPKESGTGLRAFNLKRAEATGSGRPFGVSIDRGETKGESSKKSKEKKKQKKKKKEKKKKRAQDSDEDEDSESSDEEPERKPLSIRLDLNLELEIFLRAKVKGDITITFLE